ncbi:hypothetical protein [Alistipes sp.]|uniref:hypothetical protein n=1 Tax=Alistipes sp. TaxID=1872444 RepID=UPI003AF1C702
MPLLRFEGYDGRYEDPQQIAERWPVFRLSPMAANIPFVIYRHEMSGRVQVKMLNNVGETRIPIRSVSGPITAGPRCGLLPSRVDELPDPALRMSHPVGGAPEPIRSIRLKKAQ